jgi:hypothetical protein
MDRGAGMGRFTTDMNSLQIATLILVFLSCAGALGMWLGRRLRPDHVSSETRTLVSASMAIVGTMTALVISLLISSSNTSFLERQASLRDLAADIVSLDDLLRRYGDEAGPARRELQRFAAAKTETLFAQSDSVTQAGLGPEVAALHAVEDAILGLHPGDERQRWLESQSLQQATALAAASRSLAADSVAPLPLPFLSMVVIWLAMLLLSFGLFAPGHAVSLVALLAAALALSMAFKVLLDLNTPFGGAVQTSGFPLRLSDEPLRRAIQLITR